jgi:hypothetical protein
VVETLANQLVRANLAPGGPGDAKDGLAAFAEFRAGLPAADAAAALVR